jgi:hypothetical protein
MLRHSHDEQFRQIAQIKFETINSRDTWKIINKSKNQKIILLKWVFTYNNDLDDCLIQYKTRIVIKNYLQNFRSQSIYATTLTSKVFRILMILITTYHLKTRQLDAVNAFLNAYNDELVYCQMSDKYRLNDKCYRIIKALYDQQKSSLLWLRILIVKCMKLELKLIFDESCLFIN